jgi:hypothetical protein
MVCRFFKRECRYWLMGLERAVPGRRQLKARAAKGSSKWLGVLNVQGLGPCFGPKDRELFGRVDMIVTIANLFSDVISQTLALISFEPDASVEIAVVDRGPGRNLVWLAVLVDELLTGCPTKSA